MKTLAGLLPKTLALVDDDPDYSAHLSDFLRNQGVEVDHYADSNVLLAHPGAYDYHFYVVDLMLPGVSGIDLIKILRLRSDAGLLVASGRITEEVFTDVIAAGADMYLAKPVQFEQIAAAISGVQRCAQRMLQSPEVSWKLDRHASELIAPDGTRIGLSEAELVLIECFWLAKGEIVARATLRERLSRVATVQSTDDGLTGTIYRLRRRIEKATPTMVPIQSKSRVGYVFRAPLVVT